MFVSYLRGTSEVSLSAGASQASGGNLTLYFEGVIYNRASLLAQLHSLETSPRECRTDVELVLALYQAQGEASVEELLGDFILAIHDRANQTLFCARDHMGVRPFFYYLGVYALPSQKTRLRRPFFPLLKTQNPGCTGSG